MRKVLVLNISHNELRLIMALKEMGYYVIGTGGCPGLIGEQYVDEYVPGDYSDMILMLNLAKEKKIEAVCACCNDFGVITASYIAEQLNLPGHDTLQNTLILHHKDKFKAFAAEYGIQTPKAVYFTDISDAVDWLSNATYPLIVKPIDLTGGKGVSKANNYIEAQRAIEYAYAVSRAKHIVIESFINGSQHAICTFLINQKVVAVCSNNEYSFENPYKVEIDTYPADTSGEVQDFLIGQVEKMASILHLNDGIFHMQYRLENGIPYIIEPMRRVLGNLYGLPCEKLTNMNWDLWQAKAYCGETLSDFPKCVSQKGYWAYRTVMCKHNGIVDGIYFPDDMKQYLFDELMTYDSGTEITNYKNESLGFYYMHFDSRDEMNRIMIDRYEDIHAIMR